MSCIDHFASLAAVGALACASQTHQLDVRDETVVIHVSSASASECGDGTSWAHAYRYLQTAVDAAWSLGEPVDIRIAAGTYYPDRDCAHPEGSGDPTSTFPLPAGVTILGGYAGSDEDPDARDPVLYPTILSGLIDESEPCRHVITIVDADTAVTLDGITVTGGDASIGAGGNDGGGILGRNSRVELRNCIVRDNMAGAGAGMFAENVELAISDCLFEDNWAWLGGGGALAQESGELAVNHSVFQLNSSWDGGAVQVRGTAEFRNCVFSANHAIGDRGGAISVQAGSVLALDCDFVDNSAMGSNGDGGALSVLGTATVQNGFFLENHATFCGGGIHVGSSGNCVVDGSQFDHCAADAGGMAFNYGTLQVNASVEVNCGCYYYGDAIVNERNATLEIGAFRFDGAGIGVGSTGTLLLLGPISSATGRGLVTGGIVSPGTMDNPFASASLDVDIEFYDSMWISPPGRLRLDLGGTIPGATHDHLGTTHPIDITDGGSIEIALEAGYAPAPGNEFEILEAPAFGELHLVLPELTEGIAMIPEQRGTSLFLVVVDTTCTGDTDASGTVDIADLLATLAHWGACTQFCGLACTGDANFDCVVDTLDLLAVLQQWGHCE